VKIFRVRNESKITSFEICQCRYSSEVYFEMLTQIIQSLSDLIFLRNAIQGNLHKHNWCSDLPSKREGCTLKSRSCLQTDVPFVRYYVDLRLCEVVDMT